MAKKAPIETERSSEEKIKEAARKVFTQKGYAATRTRDIAEEAGINLALLNYYFRSKEKLFEQIMLEKLAQLFGVLLPVMHDTTTTLAVKIEQIARNYIAMLNENPDLPIFVLGEIQKKSPGFLSAVPFKSILENSSFILQIKERQPDIDPRQFFLNILGMVVFPFIGRPAFINVGIVSEPEFHAMMQERVRLIPMWINAMLAPHPDTTISNNQL